MPGTRPADADPAAFAVIEAARRDGTSLAVAESLTGGLLCAALTSVPGASAVVRGGVVSYALEVKASVLGVDPHLLRARGAVNAPVARAMAAGVREVLGAAVGVSTTGVAGPDPSDGQPVGTVFLGLAFRGEQHVIPLRLSGSRESIREDTVKAALFALRILLESPADRIVFDEVPGRERS